MASVLIVLGLGAGVLAGCVQPADRTVAPQARQAPASCLLARDVMEVAQDVVRRERPAPAAAARLYAYAASVYSDVVNVGGSQASAVRATARMIGVLYPRHKMHAERALQRVASRACTVPETERDAVAAAVGRYRARAKADGADLLWDRRRPRGPAVWSVPVEPATPRAGEWQRWGVEGEFRIAAPPKPGSAQDRAELAKVVSAVAARDGMWVAKINFWGGTPGTDTPAGIWQNQLYAVLRPELDRRSVFIDRVYARIQAALAQVLADGFMECWKAKFAYWTARPSARIPGLDLSMKDPPFPSYPSGHAAVSAAAAEVLSVLVPGHASDWRAMAIDAADSRLYAGIHFEVDTVHGAALGRAVGQEFTQRVGLAALIT